MSKPLTDQERKYAELLGERALERQREMKRTRHPCCWELLTGPHHPVCPNRPKDEVDVPPLIDGQESLA